MTKSAGGRSRIQNEIEHGRFLAAAGAGRIWNWEGPAGRKRWERRVAMLTAHVRPTMQVLEVGCGAGYFTKELGKTGAQIVAIDVSQDLLDIARSSVGDALNVEFLVDNAYAMRFSDNSFDSIIGSSVLHHLEIDDALREFHRILKPGGTLVFTEPNMLNPQIALQKNIPYLKRKAGDSPDETAFFRWRLRKTLEAHGFGLIEIRPFDWLHPATPQALITSVEALGGILEKVPLLSEFAGSLWIRAEKTRAGGP